MKPLVSVIIPSFNRAAVIERAIKSVLVQDFKDWELILIDDGSTDETKKLLLPFLTNSQIFYYYQTNAGVSAARNYGAKMAKGEWLIFLDSDDELLPGSISEFIRPTLTDSSLSLVKNGFMIRNEEMGTTISRIPQKHKYNPPLTGTYMVKRSVFLDVGGYDSQLTYSENTELFYRLSEIGVEPFLLESMSLVYYESQTGGSKNLVNMDQSLSRILYLHSKTMSKTENWNLYQTLGVVQMKLFKFPEARKSLANSIRFKPASLSTYLRFLIACTPFLSKKIYYPIKSKK